MINEPASRSTWGKRSERSAKELNQLCGEAFRQLHIPPHWKFEEYDRVKLHNSINAPIQSIGAWFLDTQTSGVNTKRYRIWFHTYSERIGLLEKSIIDFGKYKLTSLASYKTPEQINDLINNFDKTQIPTTNSRVVQRM